MRRVGRWTYNSDSTYYGEAGWHLDGTHVVIDWMPDHNGNCPHQPRHRGEYQLHGWPGRAFESVACGFRDAMAVVEEMYDEAIVAALAGAA
jgi:hypothetical protein